MQPIEIITIIVCVLIVGGVLGSYIYKKVKHKPTSCSGCCGNCANCSACSGMMPDATKTEDKEDEVKDEEVLEPKDDTTSTDEPQSEETEPADNDEAKPQDIQ